MRVFDKLADRIEQANSLLCVGLDPHIAQLPEATAAVAQQFCLKLIEETQAYAAAFKPNSAFFEVFGAAGFEALKAVIAAIPPDIPVVLDAKRGDIGSTAQAYAQAAFDHFGADLVTVSGYLGKDSIDPFIAHPEKGVFVLCKTSNPSTADLQDKHLRSGQTVYEKIADLAAAWNTQGNVGLVVGATYPSTLAALRAAHPDMWFLTPGIGAQGASVEAAIQAALTADGTGALVPISRAISAAASPADAARDFREQLNAARTNRAQPQVDPLKRELADLLATLGCVQFGDFTLKSGARSPIYLDLRILASQPNALRQAARAYARIAQHLPHDVIAGLPYAALPIATAISLQTGKPLIYPRKEQKDYGTSAAVEGQFTAGQTALVVDDLITSGLTKFEAIDKLTAAGLKVTDVLVLIDRRASDNRELEDRGLTLRSVFTLAELLDLWHTLGHIDPETRAYVRGYLELP